MTISAKADASAMLKIRQIVRAPIFAGSARTTFVTREDVRARTVLEQ